MPDLEAFRRETRAWLEANAPPSMRTPLAEHEEPCWGGRKATWKNPEARQWLDRMAANAVDAHANACQLVARDHCDWCAGRIAKLAQNRFGQWTIAVSIFLR